MSKPKRHYLTNDQLFRRGLHAYVNRYLMPVSARPPAEEVPPWVEQIAEFVGQKFRKEYPGGLGDLPPNVVTKIYHNYYELARELYEQEKSNHAEIT